MLTIAVTAKGGVGKTTTVAALGAEFAARGWRTLVVDLDPAQQSLTRALGHAPSERPLEEDPVQVGGQKLLNSFAPKFALARGGPRLAVLTRSAVAGWLDAHQGYDVRVIDAPPQGVGELTVAALVRANLVLIPVGDSAMELDALVPLRALVERLPHSPPAWVFLARVHRGRVGGDRVAAWIGEEWPDALVHIRIPDEARAANWREKGVPVTVSAPTSGAAQSYKVLTDMIEKAFPGNDRPSRRRK